MSNVVAWVDREHAKLFYFSQEKMERKTFQEKHSDRHTHQIDDADHARTVNKLFVEIAEDIAGAKRILILGPGIAKHYFHNFLREHYPAIARKVTACETVDHPTAAQIATLARKHFQIAAAAVTPKGA